MRQRGFAGWAVGGSSHMSQGPGVPGVPVRGVLSPQSAAAGPAPSRRLEEIWGLGLSQQQVVGSGQDLIWRRGMSVGWMRWTFKFRKRQQMDSENKWMWRMGEDGGGRGRTGEDGDRD